MILEQLNWTDLIKKVHLLLLGPTGAGKSATFNHLLIQEMANHKPRLVIVDAFNSYRLLLEYFRDKGLSTYRVELNAEAKVSLPPFVNACRLLDDQNVMNLFRSAEADASVSIAINQERGENRCALLHELATTAVLMITGGEKGEVARMTPEGICLIFCAIVRAAMKVRDAGQAHPLPQDVGMELIEMAMDPSLSSGRQARAEDMGQAMMRSCPGLRGKLFNRPGQDWPDVDVTLVEMGTLVDDGYQDALAVAYASLMDMAQTRAERFQAENRPLIFLTDHGQEIATNELLGNKINKATHLWPTLNMRFWLATQNLRDLPYSITRVLRMSEYWTWILLGMCKIEIKDVLRFKSITPDLLQMIEAARKEAKKFMGVCCINDDQQFLFSNELPALPIALAMTDVPGKAQRRRLMEQHGCTELQAAFMIADQLSAQRG